MKHGIISRHKYKKLDVARNTSSSQMYMFCSFIINVTSS